MSRPETPLLATDCVVLDCDGRVLLIRRRNAPYRGAFALPGGFVEIGEDVETACRRELAEETGVAVSELHLIGVYSDPARDPRGHVCSVAFLAHVDGAAPVAGDDAAAAEWISDPETRELAFDHERIIADARERARRERIADDQSHIRSDGTGPTVRRPRRSRRSDVALDSDH